VTIRLEPDKQSLEIGKGKISAGITRADGKNDWKVEYKTKW
jgi:hypothetical protein